MKYIFFTYAGWGLPVASKLQKEGCEVLIGRIENIKDYVMEEDMNTAYEEDGAREKRLSLYKRILKIESADKIVEKMKKIEDPHEYFVFFDENNLYRTADKVKNLGFEGNFPTKDDYVFEMDREKSKNFVKRHYKLHTPEVVKFEDVDEAIKFLKATEDIWCLKGDTDVAKTFVPVVDDVELAKMQIIEILENMREKYEQMGEFILERRIDSIVELTPEKMYYDGVPIMTTIGIENKSFGSGNLSIQTGCAADLVFPVDMKSKICKLAFPPIVDRMARKHKGLFIWDASLLIDKKDGKIYFGEFCSNRPGYNSFFTELAQASSIDDFFTSIVKKENPLPLGTVGTSIRMFNLNREYSTEQIASNLIIDYKEKAEEDIWLLDVKKNTRGKLVTTGTDWNLSIVTGSGKSINEAVNRLYRNIESISFAGSYYRPKDDYLSLDYPTSILNRLNYGMDHNLYQLPFNVKVGDIK